MGAESSVQEQRKLKIDYSKVDNLNYRNEKIAGWTSPNERWSINLHDKVKTTLKCETLTEAGKFIGKFLIETNRTLKILEIGAGNRNATHIVTREFSDRIDSLITTDIFKFESQHSCIQFDDVHSVKAVEKYGKDVNTLLLISPYPSDPIDQYAYNDYYACKDFISQSQTEGNLIIFIGEIGASDGTQGMYSYLMDHIYVKLISRAMIGFYEDVLFGEVEKEIFIFEIHTGSPA